MNRKAGTLVVVALIAAISCSKSTKHEPPYEYVRILEGWPSWSPDGRYITYDRSARDTIEWMRYGQISVWMYDTETGRYGFLVGPGMFPKWNPEGTIMAFNWGRTIYFYYPEVKSVRQVSDPGEIFVFNWSPDGARLIFGGTYRGESGCLVIDTLGNIVRNLVPEGWRGGVTGVWSRLQNRVLTGGAREDSLQVGYLIIVDTVGNFITHVLRLDSFAGIGSVLGWSPDEERFSLNVSYVDDEGFTHGDLRIYNMSGQLEQILTEEAGEPQWSPDGSKIAFQKYTWMAPSRNPMLEPDYGRVTIWTCNPDGSDMHELLGWPQPEYDTTMFDGGYNWLSDTLR